MEPLPRVLGPSQPPLGVGDADGQAQPLGRGRRAQRVEQRLARPDRVARGGLGVGEPGLDRGARLRAIGQEAQHGGVKARRRRRRGRLQLAGGGAEQRDRLLVTASGGVLDVVGALHRSGATAAERERRTRVRAEKPAARRGDVDRVADHGMAEGEAARGSARPHQRRGEQLVERAQPLGL